MFWNFEMIVSNVFFMCSFERVFYGFDVWILIIYVGDG